MAPRQRIGLRKTHSGVQERGVERRLKLLHAAYDLLCERDIEDVTFRDIAARAGVPEGSYHFWLPTASTCIRRWQSTQWCSSCPPAGVWPRAVAGGPRRLPGDVGARVCAEPSPAIADWRQNTPEVKQADRLNDRRVGELMYEVMARHFDLPDTAELRAAFYYFIEITDLIFTISVIENGKITARMLAEAKRAGTGYLGNYLEGLQALESARGDL
jgi:hypothetical protein